MSLLRKLLLGVLLTTGVVTGLAVNTKPAMAIQYDYWLCKTRQEAINIGRHWHKFGWNYAVYHTAAGWRVRVWK
jgi:hypothetical protein